MEDQFLPTRKLVYKILLFEWEDQVQVQNDERQIVTCVTAPGENDGAEACKPHVVIFGVDVIVKIGVWDTCTWD